MPKCETKAGLLFVGAAFMVLAALAVGAMNFSLIKEEESGKPGAAATRGARPVWVEPPVGSHARRVPKATRRKHQAVDENVLRCQTCSIEIELVEEDSGRPLEPILCPGCNSIVVGVI